MKYMLTALVIGLMANSAAPGQGKEEKSPAAAQADRAKKDLDKLQGIWRHVPLKGGGEGLDNDAQAQWFWLEFEKDVCRFHPPVDLGKDKVTFTLDPSKSPNAFDLTWASDGSKRKGIYKLDEDGLTICYSGEPYDRPTKFAAKPGTRHILLTFQRPTAAEAENFVKSRSGAWAESDAGWKGAEKFLADVRRQFAAACKRETEAVQGVWRLARTQQGALDDTWKFEGQRIAFEKGAITVSRGEKVLLKGVFQLDSSKRPRTIDITVTEGEHKGKMIHGIWEIEGEGLRWCVAEPGGKDRPKVFDTNEGGTDRLARFEKEKP